jgi:NADH:ubiquinone reductase (H+-translocating)
MAERKNIIVVGGGYGGLNCAKRLSKNADLDILVLDRRNHHLFQPLLYQVAMAGLSPADISWPIRSIFSRRKNVRVLMAEVLDVRRRENKILTNIGEFAFDYLVLACGAEHSYFGHDEWEDFAPGLKTLEQATEIRRRVLLAFEKAEAATDKDLMRQWLTFVIVGGGPTGVELAGSLGEITRHTLSKDFRNIDPGSTRVILIEAGPRVLAAFADDLGRKAMRDLEALGVQIWTNCRVNEINSAGVRVGEEWVQAKTVIWAAGVKPSALNAKLGTPLDGQGRVIVSKQLTLPDQKNIFVLGDQAHYEENGKPLPGLAPVAIQQGRFAAKEIFRGLNGKPPQTFHYVDKGQMATIGRRKAVAQIGGLHISGLVAWWMWLVIHIYYLIGFKNRVVVLWQWAYSYLTFRRGARLITERDWHSTPLK